GHRIEFVGKLLDELLDVLDPHFGRLVVRSGRRDGGARRASCWCGLWGKARKRRGGGEGGPRKRGPRKRWRPRRAERGGSRGGGGWGGVVGWAGAGGGGAGRGAGARGGGGGGVVGTWAKVPAPAGWVPRQIVPGGVGRAFEPGWRVLERLPSSSGAPTSETTG